jgi:hypothetical protein
MHHRRIRLQSCETHDFPEKRQSMVSKLLAAIATARYHFDPSVTNIFFIKQTQLLLRLSVRYPLRQGRAMPCQPLRIQLRLQMQ